MTGWMVVDIVIGLAIVAFAVGVPYLITHKGMRSPHGHRNRHEARAYLHAKRRRQRQQDPVSPPPQTAGSKPGTARPAARIEPD